MERKSAPASGRLVLCIFAAFSVAVLFGIYSVIPVWQQPTFEPKHVEQAAEALQSAKQSAATPAPSERPTATPTSSERLTVTLTSSERPRATLTSSGQSIATPAPPESSKSPYLKARVGSHWHKWHGVEQLIVFGDSWSSTGFEIDGERPSDANPMGNPAYPGYTVTNGANWIDYLTYSYNESKIYTVDLAIGGATVDSMLIAPMNLMGALTSLRTQVEAEWETHVWNWSPDTSLFTIWVSVNDITAYTQETKGNFGQEFVVYADLVDQLYARGARNFLILNAPPMERSPIFPGSGSPEWLDIVEQWNVNATALNKNFTETYKDVTTFLFDAWKLFDDVMNDPCVFEESCGFEVTTDACQAYYFGATTPDYKSPDCPYSVDKYLWINMLHVTSRMHKTIARAVVDALKQA